ncbi:hypothetical protein [Sphingobium aromaticiconvertens]|uniref:hypothetical protein n=1 Tax=Sphingobium aromaticiconvertens TaxID=365341 RepID=UPI003019D297
MCEARDAIRARKCAADDLTRACAARGNILAKAFLAALAEPVPDDLRRLVEEADRKLGH